MSKRRLVLTMLFLTAPLSALFAQPESSRPRIDLAFGLGHGTGGQVRSDRTLLSGAVLVTRKVHELPTGAVVVSGVVSSHLHWRRSDCRPNDTCSGFPSDVSVGLLGGWSMREDQWNSVRVLAGPTFTTTTDGWRGLGASARVDLARQLTSRLSVVLWTQAQHQPRARSGYHIVSTAGLGVRTTRIVRRPQLEPRVTPPPMRADAQ